MAQKSILRLEPPPIFHQDTNKGKGVVFNYESVSAMEKMTGGPASSSKLQASSSRPEADNLWLMEMEEASSFADPANFLALSQPFQNNSTVFSPSSFVAGSTGIVRKKHKARKRSAKCNRKPKSLDSSLNKEPVTIKKGLDFGVKSKRKADEEGTSSAKSFKLNPQEVIPKGGLPIAQ